MNHKEILKRIISYNKLVDILRNPNSIMLLTSLAVVAIYIAIVLMTKPSRLWTFPLETSIIATNKRTISRRSET